MLAGVWQRFEDFEWHADWQEIKEQAWRNPLLCMGGMVQVWVYCGSLNCAVAFLASETMEGLVCKGMALWVLPLLPGGNLELSIFSERLSGELDKRTNSTKAGLSGGASASLMRHQWAFAFLGLAVSMPPACAVLFTCALYLKSELGRLRIDSLLPVVVCSTLWCGVGLTSLIGLASRFELAACRRGEAGVDPLCQSQKGAGRFLGHLLCAFETATECEVAILALYAYVLCAAMALAGSLLCLAGLLQERRAIGERWARLKQRSLDSVAVSSGCELQGVEDFRECDEREAEQQPLLS